VRLDQIPQSVSLVGDPFLAREALSKTVRAPLYQKYGKRVLDLTLSVVLIPLILPVVGLLWLAMRADGGPGFFGHTRIGQNGQTFRCWKIRTMVPEAEALLQVYLHEHPEAAEEWARDHKLTNDPRITWFGHFLRKTSLDELPQLWNVLRGDMSLVGPRPIVAEEMKRYGAYQSCYTSMRPGITGLWQVSGRNDISYDDRVILDVRYLVELGFWSDISIILRTARAVLLRTGK